MSRHVRLFLHVRPFFGSHERSYPCPLCDCCLSARVQSQRIRGGLLFSIFDAGRVRGRVGLRRKERLPQCAQSSTARENPVIKADAKIERQGKKWVRALDSWRGRPGMLKIFYCSCKRVCPAEVVRADSYRLHRFFVKSAFWCSAGFWYRLGSSGFACRPAPLSCSRAALLTCAFPQRPSIEEHFVFVGLGVHNPKAGLSARLLTAFILPICSGGRWWRSSTARCWPAEWRRS